MDKLNEMTEAMLNGTGTFEYVENTIRKNPLLGKEEVDLLKDKDLIEVYEEKKDKEPRKMKIITLTDEDAYDDWNLEIMDGKTKRLYAEENPHRRSGIVLDQQTLILSAMLIVMLIVILIVSLQGGAV